MAQAMPRRHCAGRSGGGITAEARWCGWTDRFAERPTPREGASRAPMQKGTPRPRARGPKRSLGRLQAKATAGRREAQRPGERSGGIDRHSGCPMIAGPLPPSRPAFPRHAGPACGSGRHVSSRSSRSCAVGWHGHETNDRSNPSFAVPRGTSPPQGGGCTLCFRWRRCTGRQGTRRCRALGQHQRRREWVQPASCAALPLLA